MSARALRTFLPILAVQFVGTLALSIALPILVFLVRDWGGVAWTYGLVAATYSAFQLVGAPLLGRWSDRVGRRTVLLVSEAGSLTAWLLFLLAFWLPTTSLARVFGASITWPLLIAFGARAVDGLTGGNVSVASAYVADLTVGDAELRQRAFGWMGMAASLGFATGPAVAGVLEATRWGHGATVLAAALFSAVATVMCSWLPRPPAPCPEGPPPQPTVTRVLGQQQRRCDRAPPPLRGLGRASEAMRRLLAATFVMFLAFNVFYAVFPVRADEALGWSPGLLGAFFTFLSFTLIVAEGPLLVAAAKRFAPSRLFGAGSFVLGLAFVGFTADGTPALFAAAAAFAVGNGLAWPTFQARMADVAGPDEQGAVQGAAGSASSLASIVGLVLGGALYASLGRSLFLAAAVLFVGVALATPLLFRRRTRGDT